MTDSLLYFPLVVLINCSKSRIVKFTCEHTFWKWVVASLHLLPVFSVRVDAKSVENKISLVSLANLLILAFLMKLTASLASHSCFYKLQAPFVFLYSFFFFNYKRAKFDGIDIFLYAFGFMLLGWSLWTDRSSTQQKRRSFDDHDECVEDVKPIEESDSHLMYGPFSSKRSA